ncbi:MAG TPA: AAA family ATPase [Thermoanaerobaculia bacterium]|nr:AAA family ATPase [Thermoanaerobaculia bacterium]
MASSAPSPIEIARQLEARVIGQEEAVREMAVALAKKIAGLRVGNILLIGSSGSGKTTLMRAVEEYLRSDPVLAARSTVIRIHANVLGEDAEQGSPGEKLIQRLLERARQQLGHETPIETLLDRAARGLVFVDEVDKIRSTVGERPNTTGIRAQEALLTLIENEAVQLTLPDWAGGGAAEIDSSGLLFVAGGAFEGLYDAVYDRVTVGTDRGALQPVTVVRDGRVHQETPFRLRDWLRPEDLFDYGMSPQFLSRFDAVVLLRDLGPDELVRIFLENHDSGYRQACEYFASQGIELAMSPAAVRRVAEEASLQPRLGARALKEVFRRVIRDYEFDPARIGAGPRRTLVIDRPEVERALLVASAPSYAAKR